MYYDFIALAFGWVETAATSDVNKTFFQDQDQHFSQDQDFIFFSRQRPRLFFKINTNTFHAALNVLT